MKLRARLRTLRRRATSELKRFYKRLRRSTRKRLSAARPVIKAAFDEVALSAIAILKDRAFAFMRKLDREIRKPGLRTRTFRKWIVATIKNDAKEAGVEGLKEAKKVLRSTALDMILKTFVNAKKNLES
jgi:hypothetical protein